VLLGAHAQWPVRAQPLSGGHRCCIVDGQHTQFTPRLMQLQQQSSWLHAWGGAATACSGQPAAGIIGSCFSSCTERAEPLAVQHLQINVLQCVLHAQVDVRMQHLAVFNKISKVHGARTRICSTSMSVPRIVGARTFVLVQHAGLVDLGCGHAMPLHIWCSLCAKKCKTPQARRIKTLQTGDGHKNFIGNLEVQTELACHPAGQKSAQYKGSLVACNACYQVCVSTKYAALPSSWSALTQVGCMQKHCLLPSQKPGAVPQQRPDPVLREPYNLR
jgi:hypothetical protein